MTDDQPKPRANPKLMALLQPYLGRHQRPGERAVYSVKAEGVALLAERWELSSEQAAELCRKHGYIPLGHGPEQAEDLAGAEETRASLFFGWTKPGRRED